MLALETARCVGSALLLQSFLSGELLFSAPKIQSSACDLYNRHALPTVGVNTQDGSKVVDVAWTESGGVGALVLTLGTLCAL